MAGYIRQLLELDDCSRRETLNSISQYSETKCSNGSSCADSVPRASGSSDAGTSSASGVPTGLGVSLPEAMAANVERLETGRFSHAEQCSLEATLAVLGVAETPWATTVQTGSRDAEITRQPYWSTQLTTPMAHAMYSEMQKPKLQALPPGPLPLMWDAREPSTAGVRPSPSYPARAAVANRKAQEQQRSMESPSAGVAHRSGGASCYQKGGRPIQTHSLQLAGDTSPSDHHGESASNFIEDKDIKHSDKDIERQSLGSYLNYLKQIDAGRILLARKINRLGFNSATVLADHYSTYGHVEHVFVPRSRSVARSQSNRPFVRSRPSGIGFVVMSESQAVDAILQEGEAHCVAGETVQLQRFRRQNFCEETEEVT